MANGRGDRTVDLIILPHPGARAGRVKIPVRHGQIHQTGREQWTESKS